jgi:hypothetical protein
MDSPHPESRSFGDEPGETAWGQYLSGLAEPWGPLAAGCVQEIERLWECLRRQVPDRLGLPHAMATESGDLVMTWDRGSHHFEIEVFHDGRYDWFYLDRDSGERVGEEDHPLGTCSFEMISRLRKTTA